jgi:Holliday junction resolvase
LSNSNYLSGRRFEYERMKAWKKKGYATVRSAGSHGLWDLATVKPNEPVNLIQCKVVNERSTGERMIEKFKANPFLPLSRTYHQYLEIKVKGSKNIMSWVE